MNIEPLESRIAPATLLALNETDQLLRFNSATPGTITATIGIGGLGMDEDVVGIDFRPATGVLYGLGVDAGMARLLTINPVSGATAQIGALFAVSGTSFGFDFNPTADRLRVIGDGGMNLSINPADGVVTTQTATTPTGLVSAAYTNNFPGAPGTTLFAINPATNMLVSTTAPAGGVFANVGALNVVAGAIGGFDIGAGAGEAFAALNVGGAKTLHTINLATGAATAPVTIGGAGTSIRGLAVLLHVWDGSADSNLFNAANWVSGIAPAVNTNESLIFPANAASLDVVNPTAAVQFNTIRFTGAGYSFQPVSTSTPVFVRDGVRADFASGTVTFGQQLFLNSQSGQSFLEAAQAGATLNFTAVVAPSALFTTAQPALDLIGSGTISGQISANSGPPPVEILGPTARLGGSAFPGFNVVSGSMIVDGSITTGAITILGGTLAGDGVTQAVTGTSGTLSWGNASLRVQGNLALSAATTSLVKLTPGTITDPLTVTGSVALNGSPLTFDAVAGNYPARFTLLSKESAGAVGGTFAGVAEGASVSIGGATYALTYLGGDGNDVVLTRLGNPTAPTITAGKTATFKDVDGDDVTVKITTGTLTDANFILRDLDGTAGGPAQLELLELSAAGFAGTSVTITAKRSALGGDGLVNVGRIFAAGRDLGAVSVSGDLGAISAGDADGTTPGLKSLTVGSMGVFGVTTGSDDLETLILGTIGKLTVRGDINAAHLVARDPDEPDGSPVDDNQGSIGSATIGGSLIGGARNNSGSLDAKDRLGPVKVGGSIVGGAGVLSGALFSLRDMSSVSIGGSLIGGSGLVSGKITSSLDIGALSIRGDIRGGTGSFSGEVDFSDHIASVFVGGSILGGAGNGSGNIDGDTAGAITVLGDLRDGAGAFTGFIDFEDVKSLTIGGSVIAGASGGAEIKISKTIGTLTIRGNVIAGAGNFGAQVGWDSAKSVFIGGSVIGGAGAGGAQIDGDFAGKIVIAGSLIGGAGSNTGEIAVDRIDSLTIGGSLHGGAGLGSGQIQASNPGIGALKIGGDWRGGAGADSGKLLLFGTGSVGSLSIAGTLASGAGAGSGRLSANGGFGAISIGSILGSEAVPVVIAGGGGPFAAEASSAVGIKSLAVKSSVERALILGGYFDNNGALHATNSDAQIGKVSVGGDWIASSLVAGVKDNATAVRDVFFGDADDAKASGGSSPTDRAETTSKISSVVIKGQALGTVGGTDHFGIVAEQIGSLKVGISTETLTGAVDAVPLGATGDFIAREDVVGAKVVLPTFANDDQIEVVSTTMVTFTDRDGDLVTVKTTKPILDAGDFFRSVSGAGVQIELINFSDDGAAAKGVGLTIIAKPQDVNGDGILDGDGFVNIGVLNANGVDLGVVSITGDLGRIIAGDADLPSTGLKSLTVQSLGEFGVTTQAMGGDLFSSVTSAGALTVKGSVRGATFIVNGANDAATSTLGAATIGGSLFGGTANGTGRISALGTIGSAKIGGSIIGGAGLATGLIDAGARIGVVEITGSLVGGGGQQSGHLLAAGFGLMKIGRDVIDGGGVDSGAIVSSQFIGSVSVGGSVIGNPVLHAAGSGQIVSGAGIGSLQIAGHVIGGASQSSGAINVVGTLGNLSIGGSVLGGSAQSSAAITATDLPFVNIVGDVRGGSGIASASIFATAALGKVSIGGSLIGGSNTNSALVVGTTAFDSVTIGRNVVGGTGGGSAGIVSLASLGTVTIGGSVVGAGPNSAAISSGGTLGEVKITGDVRGGAGLLSAAIDAKQTIKSIAIGGSLTSGNGPFSAAIRTDAALLSLAVKGSVFGTASAPLLIAGFESETPTATSDVAIGKVTIGGSVRFVLIRAGYDRIETSFNADAQIGSVTVAGDWDAASIVAGVRDVSANGFGNADDAKLSGPGSTDLAGITSQIASIVIKRRALGTVGGTDHYGFVAQEIGALSVGAVKFPLTKNVPAGNPDDPDANDPLFLVARTGDLRVHEVAL